MKYLIVDSSYLMYKSYFAFQKNHLSVTKNDGQEIITSSIFGFLNELINLRENEKYDFIFAAHDKGPYKKKLKHESYKEKRQNTNLPGFSVEKEIIKAMLYDLGIPSIYQQGYEGEEIAKYIMRNSKSDHLDLYSNDEDCFVLLRKNVRMTKIKNGTQEFFTKKDLRKKYGITPKQFKHFKALTGCSSDNIQGVGGIGPKTASLLISQFNDIDNIYKNLDSISKSTSKKLKNSKIDGSMDKSIYLTRIETPPDPVLWVPEVHLSLEDLLEYVEARSFLNGSKKIILKNIKKTQQRNFKHLNENLKKVCTHIIPQ